MSIEECLIEHCAPTLASIKTANIFNLFYDTKTQLENEIAKARKLLSKKGISITVLSNHVGFALVYVYRADDLQRDLQKRGVSDFLLKYGYFSTNIEYSIEKLKNKINKECIFPHEIGVFLGYPLGDVKGFIYNKGKNFRCCGYWKVYCNEHETIKRFEQIKKCKSIYKQQWKQGKSVLQLTVAA